MKIFIACFAAGYEVLGSFYIRVLDKIYCIGIEIFQVDMESFKLKKILIVVQLS